MSLDKSLKSTSSLVRHRNVLTRAERIEHLKENGLWSEDSQPFGLPKVVHRKAAVGKKDKTEKKTEDETAETPTEAEAKPDK